MEETGYAAKSATAPSYLDSPEPPERTGQVRDAVKWVDDRLDRLASLVTRLEDRVGAVMGPVDSPPSQTNAVPTACSEVTGALRSLGQRADEIGDRFNGIINRIEV